MAFWDEFLVDEGNEASEPQATTETNIPKETTPEPKETLSVKNTEKEKNESESTDIIPNIDFNALANSSDFKRMIYRALMGKVYRGNDRKLEIILRNKLKKINGSENNGK